jgi:hypothetical protein
MAGLVMRECQRRVQPVIDVGVDREGRDRAALSGRIEARTGLRTEQLFALLTRGHLALREAEFAAWYRGERGRGKWASQKSRSKTRGGRPTKQTERLRGWILKFVEDKSWRADKPIILLRHLLTASIGPDSPSDDTLARLVDNLFLETGEPGLRRNRRRSARNIKELRRPP